MITESVNSTNIYHKSGLFMYKFLFSTLLIKHPFIFLVYKTSKCVYLVSYVRLPVKFNMSCIFSLRPAKGLH